MYQFVLNMWVWKRVTEENVNYYATRGFITTQEAQQILATPQESGEASV
jgi:hypothetical protein